ITGGLLPVRHTITLLVDNESGVLSRIAGLFSARGFNIESLNVGETLDPETSRITLVTTGDDFIIQQIIKRFNNMVNVIKVSDLTDEVRVEREMVLVRMDARDETRAEILRTADIFRAKVVDVGPKSYTLELTGDKDKINGFIELLRPMGIKEIARTGTVAMKRETKLMKRGEEK
ncbi:MAG TPA: acetolactate synthase small subunit, partial [Thermodesulfobacteriota bacterium]|nr:acetolactate synthase small subunit [Thermodesulfobacteriota bacterium]